MTWAAKMNEGGGQPNIILITRLVHSVDWINNIFTIVSSVLYDDVFADGIKVKPVSYTHLTLPTIYSV